jgi:hypothetical protein
VQIPCKVADDRVGLHKSYLHGERDPRKGGERADASLTPDRPRTRMAAGESGIAPGEGRVRTRDDDANVSRPGKQKTRRRGISRRARSTA